MIKIRSIGGISGVGAPLSPNRVGGDGFIRSVGDRLVMDFHEGAGTTIRDLSGYGNNGILTGNPIWERNRIGFDGVDDFIDCEYKANLAFGYGNTDSPFSILIMLNQTGTADGWIWLISKKPPGAITGSNEEYNLLFSGKYKFWLFLQDRDLIAYIAKYSTSDIVTNGQWICLGSTYNADRSTRGIKIYADGIEISNITLDTWMTYITMGNTNANLRIGQNSNDSGPFLGYMSFIRINATALSAKQALQDYLYNRWRN